MTTIRATEASRGFSRLLDRVRDGDSFEVVRNGEVVARILPPLRSAFTWRQLEELLTDHPAPDADLADDVRPRGRTPSRG